MTDAPFRHGLDELASELQKKILGKYRQDHVDRLIGRIRELHRIDPSSTVFRYADGAERAYKNSGVSLPDPELWIDFPHFRRSLSDVFNALDMIWLRRLEQDRK